MQTDIQKLYDRFVELVQNHAPALIARGFQKSKIDDWKFRLKTQKIGLKIVIPVMSKMDNVQYLLLANGKPLEDVFLENLTSRQKATAKGAIKIKKQGKVAAGTTYKKEFMIKTLQEKGFEISLKKEKIADTGQLSC